MAAHIGTITGIALVPGISRNNRLYTAEAIGRAVERAQERIATGDQPLTMLTHHEAGDDSTHIVGRITRIEQDEDGAARYTADLADTKHGHEIAALVDTSGGLPFLSGVSIRGAWVGKVQRKPGPDGAPVETADDLEIDGLDFTRKPGIPNARVDTYTPTGPGVPAESVSGRVLIAESVKEALVHTTVTEADAPAPQTPVPGGGPYADPGYQADKKKRYPIDTKARAKAAWSYANQADNARQYTSAQLKRIKQRITKALRRFGVQVAATEGWLIEPAAQVTEALAEAWDMDSPAGQLYISLTNGPTTVTVSSSLLDTHDLYLVGRAAMTGACQALLHLDPDLDADTDIPGTTPEDTDTDTPPGTGQATAAGAPCPCACGCAIPATPGACPCDCETCVHCQAWEDGSGPDDNAMESAPTKTSAAETPAADPTQEKEPPAMAEPTTPSPAADTPGSTDSGITALGAKIDKLNDVLTGFITAMAPAPTAESAPAEPVAETGAAPTVVETEEERVARLVAEGIRAALPQAVQEHVEATGGPARKGLVTPVGESATATMPGLPEGAPAKPLHEYTDEEWRRHIAPITVAAVLRDRGTPQPE